MNIAKRSVKQTMMWAVLPLLPFFLGLTSTQAKERKAHPTRHARSSAYFQRQNVQRDPDPSYAPPRSPGFNDEIGS